MALIVSKQDFVSSISTGTEYFVPLYTSKAPQASTEDKKKKSKQKILVLCWGSSIIQTF